MAPHLAPQEISNPYIYHTIILSLPGGGGEGLGTLGAERIEALRGEGLRHCRKWGWGVGGEGVGLHRQLPGEGMAPDTRGSETERKRGVGGAGYVYKTV